MLFVWIINLIAITLHKIMIWINRIIIKKYFSLQYHKCCLQAIDMVGRISGRRDYFDINYEYGLEKSNWLSKTIKELYKLIINKKLTLHAACFSLYSKKLGGGRGEGGRNFNLYTLYEATLDKRSWSIVSSLLSRDTSVLSRPETIRGLDSQYQVL